MKQLPGRKHPSVRQTRLANQSSPSTPPNRLEQSFKFLGALRDGGLVVAALFYGAGYAIWSFNAWVNNLGLLPALELQYFVAGSVPVIMIALAIWFGRKLKYFLLEYWGNQVGPDAKGLWKVIRRVLTVSFSVGLFLIIFFESPSLGIFISFFLILLPKFITRIKPLEELTQSQKNLRFLIVILGFAGAIFLITNDDAIDAAILPYLIVDDLTARIFMIIFIISATLLPSQTESSWDILSIAYRYFWIYLGVPVFVLLGLIFYAERIYSALPQELGGVKPRCAFLDVQRERLSQETRHFILPQDSKENVTRSLQLSVFFSSRDYLIVHPVDSNQAPDGSVFEIPRDSITAIQWCER